MAVLVTACSGGELGPPGSLPEGPSALVDLNHPDLPPPRIEPALIRSGGPPPDGIPPVDNPKFQTIEEADVSLSEQEAVIVLDLEGDARAYPIDILMWHEIVNDTVGDVPVTITYCPLCNSAISYERTINGVETTFGTSGMLYGSALVMYDRATESLWTHFDGLAVAGVLTGTWLTPIASPLIAWKEFVTAYPEGKVLSRDTGFARQYGRNPYLLYDNPETSPAFFRGEVDDRLLIKQRVVGVVIDETAVAYTLEHVSGVESKATHGVVGSTPIVIFWLAGQVSALDQADTSKGRQVGSVAVFSPLLDGRQLTMEAVGAGFTDLETGSTWDMTGRATSGPLTGSRLERIPHLDTFWFAWATYQPDTDLIDG